LYDVAPKITLFSEIQVHRNLISPVSVREGAWRPGEVEVGLQGELLYGSSRTPINMRTVVNMQADKLNLMISNVLWCRTAYTAGVGMLPGHTYTTLI